MISIELVEQALIDLKRGPIKDCNTLFTLKTYKDGSYGVVVSKDSKITTLKYYQKINKKIK